MKDLEKNLEHWIIPSKEIYSATNGGFGGVYKAKLFHFDVRKLKHRNLVSLLGFCDHDGDMILVYEHASNGSLDKCINNRRRVYSHTWAQRLQICLDVAHGLSYLHNLGIIHRDIKSANILLGRNLEGVIGDFGLSRTSKHQSVEFSMTNVAGTPAYIDPKYFRTGKLTKQSDIYSFGVVLWEVLCGRLAILPKIGDDQEYLLHLATHHFIQNKLNLIIDPQLKEEFVKSSSIPVKELKRAWTFHVAGVEMFSLNIINSATSGFSEEHVIGKGTLGKVYTGTLSVSMQPKVVAIKRLEMPSSYEEGGFFKDVAMMSSYIDDNIIPFHGFCEEANEMILVFEHATNRSLDKHLDNSTLTWANRLKISIGVAQGLQYIHSCVKPLKAVHGDIKSSHILLDDFWNATISDFIISKCEGALGYRDPEYVKTGVLTKESDVYAFGVVLFELLSGRPAIVDVKNGRQHTSSRIFNADPATSEERKDKDEKVVFLSQLAARCFEDRKLEAIIFHDIKEKADPNSIDIFSTIAYQCLQQNKENRPTMARVIEELERAFNSHDEWEWEQKLPKDYNKIIQMSKHPVPSTTKKDPHCLLSSGILLSKENVWFSISMNGLKCEMVPATKFSYGNASSLKWASIRKSRFKKVAKMLDGLNISQYPNKDKTSVSNSRENLWSLPCVHWKTENKWLMVELFRFVNKDQTTDLEILLESFSRYYCGSCVIFVEGIEFRPVTVDAVVNKEIKNEKDVQGVYQLGSDMHSGEKSGNDYHELFSVSKVSMKKCYMLSAKSVIYSCPNVKCIIRASRSQIRCRFAEVVEILSHYEFRIKCNIERELLSPNTNYGCFLVFQISEECRGLKGPMKGLDSSREGRWMDGGFSVGNSKHIPMDMKLTNFEGKEIRECLARSEESSAVNGLDDINVDNSQDSASNENVEQSMGNGEMINQGVNDVSDENVNGISNESNVTIDKHKSNVSIPTERNVVHNYSYVNVAAMNCNVSNKLEIVPTFFENGNEVVVFNEELVKEGCMKQQLTLCGYFVGCGMGINELMYNLRSVGSRLTLHFVYHNTDQELRKEIKKDYSLERERRKRDERKRKLDFIVRDRYF
ncbi:phloem protein 2-like protein [Tanacetum coccineum]